MSAHMNIDNQILQIQREVARSISLGVLCGLQPGGVPYATYTQGEGDVRYSSDTYEIPASSFFQESFHLASNLALPLSKLVAHEMGLPKPPEDSLLSLLAGYPFIFATYGLSTVGDDIPINIELLEDITFTHFMLVGGEARIGNDAVGFVVSQESQPGDLIEAIGFVSPSSVIAPGYSEVHLKNLVQQENLSMKTILNAQESFTSSFIEEVAALGDVNLRAKIVYGVASSPFNNIDQVISKISLKRNKKRKVSN